MPIGTLVTMARGSAARLPQASRALASTTPAGLPVARDGLRSVLLGLFGASAPTTDVISDPGDEGLAGVGSASWQVLGEPAAIAGGLRALLMQTMHPLAMAGVAQQSGYAADPLGRLSRTSQYVTTVSFGSTPQALKATRIVRAVHKRIRGTAPDGRPYSAEDPRLLVWVSVTFTASMLAADRLFAPTPVSREVADRFVAEQSRMHALLDPRADLDAVAADPDAFRRGMVAAPLLPDLPADVRGLERVLESFAPELAVGEQAREALKFLRWPPLPGHIRAPYASLLLGALASLDPEQRRLLGAPANGLAATVAAAQCTTLLSAMRLAAGRSPAATFAEIRATSPA